MRAIDADALQAEYKKYNKGKRLLLIDTAPTIIPERKRGRWEIYIISMIDGEGCRCSECGFEGASYWEFCPNCGADMRGGQNEAD